MNSASFLNSFSVVTQPSKKKAVCCILLVLLSFFSYSQDSVKDVNKVGDTSSIHLPVVIKLDHCFGTSGTYPYNKKRVKLIAAANVIGYGGIMVGLYSTWYKNYPQSKFHTFDDFPEWKQVDKIGHAYSAYAAGKASMELWRWTGISRKQRIWIGGMSGAVYQTVIETLDGFSSQWGWSWGDIGANLIGSGILVSQELAWDEQRIQFKWSFHRKQYDDPSLNVRSNKVFGKTNPERFLKDYNGQTYWLSTNLRSFFPHSKIPAWLNVSVGTGAEGMFGARENIGRDKDGNIEFYRPDVKRYRQWYLAPDIDLTKIKTNKKAIKMALMILNILKFPTPSLEYSNGGVKFNWVHF
ncbi:MAG: DUF2279 domain-containing protein [Ferruginibacter sp.]